MTGRVKYFAAARERAGVAEEPSGLSARTTAGAFLKTLAERHPALGPLLPHLRVAVNQELVELDAAVGPDDEVALIPPVSGGSGAFRVSAEPLSLDAVVRAVSGPGQGGVVTFSGAVRDSTKGQAVVRLEYEAYGPMAQKQLEAIAAQARAQWAGALVAVHHRVGTLVPGELAVVIAASAPHRDEAFQACRFTIERLKAEVAIWKREVFADGAVWVGLGP